MKKILPYIYIFIGISILFCVYIFNILDILGMTLCCIAFAFLVAGILKNEFLRKFFALLLENWI